MNSTANKLQDPKAFTKTNTVCGTGLSGGGRRHHSAPPSTVGLTSLKKSLPQVKRPKMMLIIQTDETKLV